MLIKLKTSYMAEAVAINCLTYVLKHPDLEKVLTEANRNTFLKDGIKAFKASTKWFRFKKALAAQDCYQRIMYDQFKIEVKQSIADFGIKVYSTHIDFYADELQHTFDCAIVRAEKNLAREVASIDRAVNQETDSLQIADHSRFKFIAKNNNKLMSFFKKVN